MIAGSTLIALLASCGQSEPSTVTVFAAASTNNALSEIAEQFTKQRGIAVVSSFASSSTLAKQIAEGAPANIFLSANPSWMDYLEKRDMIAPESRSDLLFNQLVLIAPRESQIAHVAVLKEAEFLAKLGTERLALGDPDHVPAGIYAKKCLRFLGLWDQMMPRLARAMDVRAALALVERKEAPLGIVYQTDALISKKVKVVANFPERCHGPITYPVAGVLGNQNQDSQAFLQYLESDRAGVIFRKHGFVTR